MGGHMAERVRRAGHEVVGYDRAPGKRDVETLEALVEALAAPRVVWVVVPARGPAQCSKSTHTATEYALRQAYGEAYDLLAAVDLIEDVPGVIKSWTQGTVIRSWLLDLLVRALDEDPNLDQITGYAEDSGEG